MIEAIISGITLGFILSISVGPVIFAIIKQSLNNGHKGGYAFVAGVSASDVTMVLVCNALSSLFQKAVENKLIIGVAGSIFLIILGVYTLFFKKVVFAETHTIKTKQFKKRELLGIFLSGYFMNTLNPGAFIFWLAATTKIQQQALGQLHTFRYLVTVFAICLTFVLTSDILKVLLAGRIRTKLTPHNIHIVNKISGIILIGFGVALVWGLFYTHNNTH